MDNIYKIKHRAQHYDRIEITVPKGMKQIVHDLAADKNLSVSAYIQDLIRKDQEGMFDTMQIAEKNRERISGITGNMHDGYIVIFSDGVIKRARTKKDVRKVIIEHCGG